jgi:hypothetical protein
VPREPLHRWAALQQPVRRLPPSRATRTRTSVPRSSASVVVTCRARAAAYECRWRRRVRHEVADRCRCDEPRAHECWFDILLSRALQGPSAGTGWPAGRRPSASRARILSEAREGAAVAIDWEKWKRVHRAELWQFVALMSGLDPGDLLYTEGYGCAYAGRDVDAADRFQRHLDIAVSHVPDRLQPRKYNDYDPMGSEILADAFWRWAADLGLPVPAEVRQSSSDHSALARRTPGAPTRGTDSVRKEEWTNWSQILPAINEWTGWNLKTPRSAQRRLEKHAVSLVSSGEKGTHVTLTRAELERLPRAQSADSEAPTRRRPPTGSRH